MNSLELFSRDLGRLTQDAMNLAKSLPDGPNRDAVLRTMSNLMSARLEIISYNLAVKASTLAPVN